MLCSPSCSLLRALTLAFWLFTLSISALGQTESVLYTFGCCADGDSPYGNLVFDGAGNLYGTTNLGGSHEQGAVFELSPLAGGGWKEAVIYSFGSNVTLDGKNPSSGLVFDSAGNLYGTTTNGGFYGLGTVFELSVVAGGFWAERVLYSFAGGLDVSNPGSSLVFDGVGNLYGTASVGGVNNMGGVYELSPASEGLWTERVILAGSQTHDGNFLGPAVFDNRGSMYVAAAHGGEFGAGTVYQLSPNSGNWKASLVYTFLGGNRDGYMPTGGLTFQAPNLLFGVTEAGGATDLGIAFQLTLGNGGTSTETILHTFGATDKDGENPQAPLTIGPGGRLYGTTFEGGRWNAGIAFVLVETAGAWRETVLHTFAFSTDTGSPDGGVVLDSAGNLYGTGHNGGPVGFGGVYEIVP